MEIDLPFSLMTYPIYKNAFQSFQVYFRGLILYLSLNSLGEDHKRKKERKKKKGKKHTF